MYNLLVKVPIDEISKFLLILLIISFFGLVSASTKSTI